MNSDGPGDIPREPFTFETVYFEIPKAAAAAIDKQAIAEHARAAGFEHVRYEENTKNVRNYGAVRITCRRYLAAFITDQLRELALTSEGDLLFAAVAGAKAALEALS